MTIKRVKFAESSRKLVGAILGLDMCPEHEIALLALFLLKIALQKLNLFESGLNLAHFENEVIKTNSLLLESRRIL
jgi:hypothetical protein